MARKPTPPEPSSAILKFADLKSGIRRLKKRLDRVSAFDVDGLTEENFYAKTGALTAFVEEGLLQTFGANTIELERYQRAATFDHPFTMGGQQSLGERIEYIRSDKTSSISLLESAIELLEERLEEAADLDNSPAPKLEKKSQSFGKKIFVVHGHDDGVRETVARFLEGLGYEPIILHEQASKGQTIIEKIEEHSDVGFAVILLTPDDVGGKKGEAPQPRARQNVVLELGFFIGKLGRERVCALKKSPLETPSDFDGIVYIPYDNNNGWRQALGKEMQEVGFLVDWNSIMAK